MLDLAVANYCSNDVSVLLGNGDGTFQPALTFGAGSSPTSVAVGDVNGDGKPDLAVANAVTNYGFNGTVLVLLGNGDGTFHPALYYAAGLQPYSVIVSDFNGDGWPDLASANAASNGTASLLLGRGGSPLQAAPSFGEGRCPLFGAVGGVNGEWEPGLAGA